MITENLSTLKIHKLTQEQYDRALAAGNIDENALYLTPEEGVDLSGYATLEDLNDKADKEHVHDIYETKEDAQAKLDEAEDYTDLKIASEANARETGDTNTLKSANEYTDTKLVESKEYTNTVASGKANASHTHDDKYYTETEIDSKLSNKSDKNHNHDEDYDAKGVASAVQTNLNALSDEVAEHIDNADIHFTTAERTKLSGIATGANKYTHPNSGVTAGTYKSVTVNAQGHITGGSNPTTLAGYGITDAEAKGTANSAVSTHNTSTSAHSDIRDLITSLTTKVNNFLDVDDTTTDQLSEVIALIEENQDLIESITTSKVNVSDIVNNLTTNVSTKPLSAAQGVSIKALIDALQDEVDAKLDISQGVEYAGMVMGVDESGNITPTSAQMTEIVYHEEDQIVEIVTFSDSDIEKQLASI